MHGTGAGARELEARGVQACDRLGQHLIDTFHITGGADNGEFIATDAIDLGFVPQQCGQPLGKAAQQLIAAHMAEAIVVILEAVQIDKRQAATRRQAIQFDIQRETVGQPGQRVAIGHAVAVFEPLQRKLFFMVNLRELIRKHKRQQYRLDRHGQQADMLDIKGVDTGKLRLGNRHRAQHKKHANGDQVEPR